jgi:hypothetical protein
MQAFCKEETLIDVANGTMDTVYLPLIDMLNRKRDRVVFWYCVESTTSDFDIYLNLNAQKLATMSFSGIKNRLRQAVVRDADSLANSYKYRLIDSEGVRHALTCSHQEQIMIP